MPRDLASIASTQPGRRQYYGRNYLVKVTLPDAPDIAEAMACHLALWEVPSDSSISADPVMTLGLHCPGYEDGNSERKEYLLEMRDVASVVSYLVRRSRYRGTISGFVNVEIHRTHVVGLYDSSCAAESLFLRPLYPYLNGVLATVSCTGSDFVLHVRHHQDSTSDEAQFAIGNPADTIMLKILEATAGYRSAPPRAFFRWDIEPALWIWNEELAPLVKFTIDHRWEPNTHGGKESPVWQVSARRTLNAIQHQMIQQPSFPRPGFPDTAYSWMLMVMERKAIFSLGIGYLNLSYLPSSPSFERDLLLHNITIPSQHASAGQDFTPFCMAKMAARRLSKLRNRMKTIVIRRLGPQAMQECLPTEICCDLVRAEVAVRTSDKGMGQAWKYLFGIFGYLSPDPGQSKQASRWVRERMPQARAAFQYFIDSVDQRDTRQGRWRGVWWRGVICKRTVKALVEEKYGQNAAGAFGEAMFEDLFKLTDCSLTEQLGGMEAETGSNCCRGSHC